MTLTMPEAPDAAPGAVAFDPQDRGFLDDPYPTYARLRVHDPVHRSASGAWWITRHADVADVFADRRFGKSAPPVLARPSALGGEPIPPSLLFQNPPAHTRLRTFVAHAFSPRTIERLRPHIAAVADDLIDAAADRREFDLVDDVAFPLPAIIIAELLGVPARDRDRFRHWSTVLARSIDRTAPAEIQARGAEGREALADYFAGLIAERRQRPRADLISDLLAVEHDGDRLEFGELLAMCTLLLAAGHETTVNLIANGVLSLLRRPDQLELLRSHAELMSTAIEEFARFESPAQMMDRVVLEDLELHGRRLLAGDRVIVVMGAANRDPSVFSAPDQLDITRQHNPHVAFGRGIHYCLGGALARLEGELTIAALLDRCPRLQLAGPLVRGSNPVLRTLRQMPVSAG
jgi:pimeloyl-[acyl-carrier protein] synthase